jgi:very-short-patch-repair endonuclease
MSGKPQDPSQDRVIEALAARQHGVVGRRQLLAKGIAGWSIEYRLQVGRLQPVHRGVYSLGPPSSLRRASHWMAAVLACGPGAVLSHGSAAAHWDLRRSAAGVIDVTVPRTGIARRKALRIHTSTTLTEDQCTVHDGIPVTTVARTLIDLADRFDRRTVERATDQAEVLKLFDLRAIEAAIGANRGRKGATVVQRVIESYAVGAALTESELEDEFLRLCARYGIPRPDIQKHVGPGRVDFIWREQRLIVEVDSWRWHGGRSKWESDRKRDIRLQRLGYRVARVSYLRMFREPAAVADDLKALLSAAPSAAHRRAG